MSWLTSGTITASSFCATQPAIPCPILMRTSFSACAPFPDRQLEVKLLLDFIDQQQRPRVRTQELVDFFHDGAQDLIELQGGGEGLAEFVEHRDFARFALFSPDSCVAAPLDAAKILSRGHWMP